MGASGVCRAAIRKRRSGLFCPSIWKRTRCSPIGTRRHAVGVYPAERSSTYTSANGSAFTLRHRDSCGVAATGRAARAGAGGVVITGAAAVGAGTALIVALGGVGFGAGTTGGVATGAVGVCNGIVVAGAAVLGLVVG